MYTLKWARTNILVIFSQLCKNLSLTVDYFYMRDNMLKYEDDYKKIFLEEVFFKKCKVVKNTVFLTNDFIEFKNGVLYLKNSIFYPKRLVISANNVGTLKYFNTEYKEALIKIQKHHVYFKRYEKNSTNNTVDFDLVRSLILNLKETPKSVVKIDATGIVTKYKLEDYLTMKKPKDIYKEESEIRKKNKAMVYAAANKPIPELRPIVE